MPEALPRSEVVDWADLPGLDGQPLDSARLAGKAVLVVNVASRCGLTPQYEGLERLQRTYSDRGFTVLGVPCNQFAGQEPGTPEEIEGFCQTTYGTTFPISETGCALARAWNSRSRGSITGSWAARTSYRLWRTPTSSG